MRIGSRIECVCVPKMASETTSIGLENCEPSSHEDVKSSDIDRARSTAPESVGNAARVQHVRRRMVRRRSRRTGARVHASDAREDLEPDGCAAVAARVERRVRPGALGAVAWGAASDSFGRRPAFLGSMAVATGFAIASAFAPGFYAYCVLRAATGFGIGGNLPVSIALTAEFLGPKERAPTIVLMHFFYEAGELLTTGLGALLLSSQWRLFLWSTAAPAAAIALFVLSMSPRESSLAGLARQSGRRPSGRTAIHAERAAAIQVLRAMRR